MVNDDTFADMDAAEQKRRVDRLLAIVEQRAVEKDLSLRGVAQLRDIERDTGLGRNALNGLREGKMPRLPLLRRLAPWLDVSVVDLLVLLEQMTLDEARVPSRLDDQWEQDFLRMLAELSPADQIRAVALGEQVRNRRRKRDRAMQEHDSKADANTFPRPGR